MLAAAAMLDTLMRALHYDAMFSRQPIFSAAITLKSYASADAPAPLILYALMLMPAFRWPKRWLLLRYAFAMMPMMPCYADDC